MSREWKPGDVAMVTMTSKAGTVKVYRAIFDGCNNQWVDGEAGALYPGTIWEITDVRPLIVIDPEDREQVEQLRDEFDRQVIAQNDDPDPRDVTPAARGNALQAALRSLVTPPKPDEPTGLGAVVEDHYTRLWVRLTHLPSAEDPWKPLDSPTRRCSWPDVAAVKVLSEGVTP